MAIISSEYGVDVSTWGSSPYGGDGTLPYIESVLFGKNVGHTRLDLTLPIKFREQVQKYCEDENGNMLIPYKITPQKVSVVADDGTVKIHEEEVIRISWSWWPDSTQKQRYALNPNPKY